MIKYSYKNMKKVIIATHNKGKLNEYKEMLSKLDFECISLYDLNYFTEIKETGNTFSENSMIKAKTIYDLFLLPVIADDSGLMVDALDGAPSVHSHRFASDNATDKENRDKVVELLKEKGLKESKVHFTCLITYIDKDRTIQTEGRVDGLIILDERGSNGFGYDSIFYYPPYKKTVAEMSDEEKNSISHRHNAIVNLKKELEKIWKR